MQHGDAEYINEFQYILLSSNLMDDFRQHGDSEIA